MRVAVVGPTHPYKGGVTQHTTLLAHNLRAAGHDATIESWSRQYPERLYPGLQRVEEVEGELFPFVRSELAWNRPDSWWSVGSRLARTVDAALVVQTTSVQLPALLAIAGRARRGARVGVIAHNVLPHERRPWDEALTHSFLAKADGVVVHSPAEAAQAEALGATNVATATLPFFYPYRGHTRSETRSNTLLFAGFVREYKGLGDLLGALALAPDGPRLLVVGEHWGDDAGLRAEIARLGLEKRVDLRLGYATVDEMSDAFASVDALVTPYRSGTGSVMPRIAFQHGVPVIATTVGDLPTQVRDGVDGLLVPPNDPAKLAAAIERLYSGDELVRLSASVEPPDTTQEWASYLEAVDDALRVTAPSDS
jgi:D-inositol-3-phosphate glycosyltransferase